ncbi:TIGR03862 family flavoprotein [Lysobacter gummosus]|uniref:TIGR03862 family flavoprotein n=1 Tax=Lysobacter gummosus TaxID=262324 RepID=A0ABY3XIS4_9GAMM|nr:TIGR03862 family flavoprotein [Lysobacter gummosus]ALN91119.1 flavo, HI0933 family protein [Lysobacter gummosus]UNP31542.1 TIGR03862 family flavoprotein [Lysobacter gummosus]
MPTPPAPTLLPLPGLAVIGGGPAGLMAAQAARAMGVEVDLFEAKGSVGRKFLIAGKGGLNLTHGEPRPAFDHRYGRRSAAIAHWLDQFDADALREWARGFGVETYIGSSGRVFPMDRKAALLLRGWVRRLREDGVRFHVQHRCIGWSQDGALRFDTPSGLVHARARASVFALGGGSWPELGSDGAWTAWMGERGVDIAPLQPSNCGFDIGWSAHFAERHAGAPLKPVIAHWRDGNGIERSLQGECVVTATGIEGSLVYALSATLRDAIAAQGSAVLELDLAPGRDLARLQHDFAQPRRGRSVGEHLRRQTGLDGVKAALVFEVLGKDGLNDAAVVARTIKRLPLRLRSARPIAEAISSAGGVRLEAMDSALAVSALADNVFCAGEMLDWEAPTGGYLLTACFASGLIAGRAAAKRLLEMPKA